MAPSSMQQYHRAWDLFRESMTASSGYLCVTVALPLTVNQISIFVAYLYTRHFSPSSMVSYTSALGYVHRLLGYFDPTSATLIQKLLAGATKIAPTIDPRLPITVIILHRLCQATVQHVKVHYHQVLLRAMFTTAFFGLMRLAELTVTKHGQVIISIDQLSMSPQQAIINITHFKHNHSAKPVDVPLSAHPSQTICPVYNLAVYLQFRGYAPGPLFSFQSGKSVARRFFTKHLSFLLTAIGYDVARYKSHSFRIGGASFYADLGYSDSQIRLLGRWNSNAFIPYIRAIRATGGSSLLSIGVEPLTS